MTIYAVLACIGMMFILKYGTIFYRPRCFLSRCNILKELFSCSLCLGFWVGIIIGSFLYHFSLDHDLFLLPFVSSACCWIIDNLNNLIQSIEIELEEDDK